MPVETGGRISSCPWEAARVVPALFFLVKVFPLGASQHNKWTRSRPSVREASIPSGPASEQAAGKGTAVCR